MFHIVLVEPEIPPNTGNVIRLCANTGAELHLIRPLGFTLDSSKLKRAQLDYAEMARVHVHANASECFAALASTRFFGIETTGTRDYTSVEFKRGDAFVFGPETRGLSATPAASFIAAEHWLRVPMRAGSRSLNLSNCVAVVLYEAWRQNEFS